MTQEVAIAAKISADMNEAAAVARRGATKLAAMNLCNQWESSAADAAQRQLQRQEAEMLALAQASVEVARLARESMRALLAMKQAGKI